MNEENKKNIYSDECNKEINRIRKDLLALVDNCNDGSEEKLKLKESTAKLFKKLILDFFKENNLANNQQSQPKKINSMQDKNLNKTSLNSTKIVNTESKARGFTEIDIHNKELDLKTPKKTINADQSETKVALLDSEKKVNKAEVSIKIDHQPADTYSEHSSTPIITLPTDKNYKDKKALDFYFKIPNGKVGEFYKTKIHVMDTGETFKFRNVQLKLIDSKGSPLEKIGLLFNEDTQEITGTPSVHGEQILSFQWTIDNKTWMSDLCDFFINPDPKTLWKVIEPPENALYTKDHTDSKLVETPTNKIIAASRRGRSHEHSGTFRDDDFSISFDTPNGWSLMIVADGAGSAKSSLEGSRIAVNTFSDYIKNKLNNDISQTLSSNIQLWRDDSGSAGQDIGKDFFLIFQGAAKEAITAIETEASSKKTTIKDYSTTLLAAVTRQVGNETFIATFWMGDGAIAVYGPKNKVRVMGEPDSGEFAGQTRFLDRAALNDENFGKRVRIGCYTDYEAIFLMTDGVSDPRFETDSGLEKAELWDELWEELKPICESNDPEVSLLNWLNFFEAGHHDDRTMVLSLPKLNKLV